MADKLPNVYVRSVAERLARLRTRLKDAKDEPGTSKGVDSLRAVMLGLLDLLEDEL